MDFVLNKNDALIAIYHEISNEIARLRDNEFRIAFLGLGLDASLIAVFFNGEVARRSGLLERWTAISVSSVAVAFLLFYLIKTHQYLTEHRTIRRRIENLMLVHKPDVYLTEALFPQKWRPQHVKFKFQLTAIVIPLTLLMLVSHAGAMFLIWKATS